MNMSRSLLMGLIASATLNVFLVGGVVGVLWMRQSEPKLAQADAPQTLQPAAPVADEVTRSTPSGLRQVRPPPPSGSGAPVAGQAPARSPLWMAGKGLSQESRQALRRTLRDANQRNQPITRQARAERQAALLAFRAKPYDPAEVSKRLSAARALDAQARDTVEAALARFAATLSAEERSSLAEGLAQVYAPRQNRPQADDQ